MKANVRTFSSRHPAACFVLIALTQSACTVTDVQLGHSKELLGLLSKPPAMLPSQSAVTQPGLPPGLRLIEPPYPFPTANTRQGPEPPVLESAPPGAVSAPNVARRTPAIGALPRPFPGYPDGPFLPIPQIPPIRQVSVVVSDFYLTTSEARTIRKGEQIDYLIPNEDELTFTNNHHKLTVEATTSSKKKFSYNILVNGYPIASGSHEGLKNQYFNYVLPILDNLTYLTVPGPGRTNTISFRGIEGKGNVTIKFVHFDYHKRLRLHTH